MIEYRFWYTASAVPWYQCSLTRFCGGRISTNSPSSSDTMPHPMRMWRLSDSDLYCVAMKTRRKPELMQLLRTKSMMRYGPPKYTAGLARSLVSGYRRSPAPPARTMTRLSSSNDDMLGLSSCAAQRVLVRRRIRRHEGEGRTSRRRRVRPGAGRAPRSRWYLRPEECGAQGRPDS